MTSIIQPKTVKKGSKKIIKYILAIITLGITIAIITLIVHQVQLINQYGTSPKVMIFIAIESIFIFILPCIFNPQYALRRIFQPFLRGEQVHSRIYEIIPLLPLAISVEHHHPIIIRCPICHFENPGNKKRCLNCRSDLLW